MDYFDFAKNCEKGFCLRKAIKSKKCSEEYKRKDCFEKYMKVKLKPKKQYKIKIKIDEKEKEVRRQCWERDTNGKYTTPPKNGYVNKYEAVVYCGFFNTMKDEERREFIQIANKSLNLFQTLDWVHIDGRNENKYCLEKTMLGNRLSHSLFDTYKSPVNGKDITREEREQWQKRLLEYVKNANKV